MKRFFFIDHYINHNEGEKNIEVQWIYLTDRRLKLNMQFMYILNEHSEIACMRWWWRRGDFDTWLWPLSPSVRKRTFTVFFFFSKTREQQNEKKIEMHFQYFDCTTCDEHTNRRNSTRFTIAKKESNYFLMENGKETNKKSNNNRQPIKFIWLTPLFMTDENRSLAAKHEF